MGITTGPKVIWVAKDQKEQDREFESAIKTSKTAPCLLSREKQSVRRIGIWLIRSG